MSFVKYVSLKYNYLQYGKKLFDLIENWKKKQPTKLLDKKSPNLVRD